MPGKITTADCKVALTKEWTQFFGDLLPNQAAKWKRVLKYGKRGTPVDRIFHHDTLPLHGLVVEENGVIVRAVIRGFAEFEVDQEGDSGTEDEQKMLARAESKEGAAFLTTHACFRPSDFTFRMCTTEEAADSGEVFYELYPKRDFGRAHWQGDAIQTDHYIGNYIPDGDGEATEGTYATPRSIEDAVAALREKGFIPEDEFVETTRRKGGGEDEN